MGAWGHDIYSNDTAMDFFGELIDHAFQQAKSNEAFLVVADMIKNHSVARQEQAEKIKKVINNEIKRLKYWKEDCQEPRKELLKELLAWFENEEHVLK